MLDVIVMDRRDGMELRRLLDEFGEFAYLTVQDRVAALEQSSEDQEALKQYIREVRQKRNEYTELLGRGRQAQGEW